MQIKRGCGDFEISETRVLFALQEKEAYQMFKMTKCTILTKINAIFSRKAQRDGHVYRLTTARKRLEAEETSRCRFGRLMSARSCPI